MNTFLQKYKYIFIALTSLFLSRLSFYLINDPEGPNLLIVSVAALGLFLISIFIFSLLKNKSVLSKLVVAIVAQALIAVCFGYFGGRVAVDGENISDNISTATSTVTATNTVVSTTSTSTVGIANPASTFCIEKGGSLQMQTREDGGQYGLCYFEDARACEEWAMMRGECPVGGVKTTGYDTIDQKFCAWSGGRTFAVENSQCTFANGKVCATVDFYNGTCTK